MADKNYEYLDSEHWTYDEQNNEIILDGALDSDEYVVEYRPESPNYNNYELIDERKYLYQADIERLTISHLLQFEEATSFLIIPPKSVELDLRNMYSIEPGSPVTRLASELGVNDNEVEIENGEEFLPEPPNLISIYYKYDRNNFETILYQKKEGNMVKDLIRGIQGRIRSWPEDTTVGRLITAKDLNDMQFNIEKLDSKLSQAAAGFFDNIMVNGGRADSRYIPFEEIDGGTALINN